MADAYASKSTKALDNLFSSLDPQPKSDEITLLSGNEIRGTLLGKVTKVVPTIGTAGGGNTGNGTITLVVGKAKTKLGIYTILMTGATTFRVFDPDGEELKEGLAAGAYSTEHIAFTFTAGGTPMIAGDSFTVTVTAGSGKYKKSLAAAVDGSQEPCAILAEDTDASSAEKVTLAYHRGAFNEDELTYGTGHTKASVKEALRLKNIYLEPVADTPILDS